MRAAMPGFIARKLCPHLVIVSPNYDKYRKVSKDVQKVLSEYDPDFCSVGLDESYLDITDYVKKEMNSKTVQQPCCTTSDAALECGLLISHYVCAESIVQDIRQNIQKATGLTASAGIAPNKMLAKIASDTNKPNGQFMIKPVKEEILAFLKDLPVRKVMQ